MNSRRLPMPMLLAALAAPPAVSGCDERSPSQSVLVADAGVGAGGGLTPEGARLVVRVPRPEIASIPAEGQWRARVESAGHQVADAALTADGDGRLVGAVEGLTLGPHTITVWLDRNGNGALDGCPFPPQLEDAAHPDAYENLVGAADLVVEGVGDSEISVEVDRRTCGPGDAATGLNGTLRITGGAPFEGPLFVRMSPSESCPTARMAEAPTLTVALSPAPIEGEATFTLGELLPGCFDLDFFIDGDADGLPTPCDGVPAGGDRVVGQVLAIEVTEGARTPLPAVIELSPSVCPESLTGLKGLLGLGQALVEAESRGELPAGSTAAKPRLALTALQTGTTFDWPLAFDAAPADLARPFVISGLEPGPYDVNLYLDGDADEAFGPCGGLNGGVDAIFEQRMAIEVSSGALTDLGEARLQRSPACAEADTELRVRPDIELEEGPVGSGRPVRLELIPAEADGERRSVLLFENHRSIDLRPAGADGAWHLAVQIRPGRYEARVFVDTNGDGVFGSCAVDPYQDRATAEPITLDFGREAMLDLDAISIRTLPCDVPDAAIGPEFAVLEGVTTPPRLNLRFEVTEAGGWMEAYPLRNPVRSEALPYVQPPLKLAPGSYTLRAWLDEAEDGIFDSCESDQPDALVGQATFTLDAENRAARPRVELAPACPR